MEVEIESKNSDRRIRVDIKLLRVNCMDSEEVAMRSVSGRRIRAVVATVSRIALQGHGFRYVLKLRLASSAGQRRDGRRNVKDTPVPETRSCWCIRVEARDRDRLRSLGELVDVPCQLRGNTSGSPLLFRKLITLGKIGGCYCEGRKILQRCVRIRAWKTRVVSVVSHTPNLGESLPSRTD